MAHYALLDENNIVQQVITGVDENVTQIDENGNEVGGSAEAWERFYESLPWFAGLRCKRTSYNSNIRKNYAGIGSFYDEAKDAFILPAPYPSWILNETDCKWYPPVPYPESGYHTWDEQRLTWVEVQD